LRPEARFHDGSRMTAHDVAFSLSTLKDKGHPIIVAQLRDFAGCKVVDDGAVEVRFAPKRARDVPLYVAGLPIFSRAFYEKRTFDESSLDIPLGSGPYQVGRFEAGRYIEYKRTPNWWGAELPVPRGVHLAHLGDALQLSRHQGWPRQAGGAAGRHAVRRAGLVHQHAPQEIPEHQAARGAERRVRFRVDQQDCHVRLV
jgi:hypothetical protein